MFLKSANFWWRCFLLEVNVNLCKKQWGKMTSVSININFLAKMSNLWKIDENLGEMLTFPLSVHYYWKWSCFCKTCLFLEKCDFLCEGLYTLTNCLILVKKKKLQFLRIMLIFIKVFNLLENCYFDSKYHFVQWYLG